MILPKTIQRYLLQQVRDDGREFVAGSCGGIDQVVVIPALAEKDALFSTLQSLSANPPSDLGATLVICVINNRVEGVADREDIEDNRQTMMFLRSLIQGNSPAIGASDQRMGKQMREIRSSGLRLGFIDASSQGMEMPEKGGGVGFARKLGLDMALRLFDYKSPARKILFNLDADTWVETRYVSEVRQLFEDKKVQAAVVDYKHRPGDDPILQAAICSYEIFLRYYVLGLTFAGSPYAFHAIGSTMVCTPESYVAVRGMNRREAAEDFYFLDKLAKLGHMAQIKTTTVFPSARPSRRVPFGTGRRMIRFLAGEHDEYLLYDPEVFRILRRWLEMMAVSGQQEAEVILVMAVGIHPLLGSFLEINHFLEVWPRIQRNHRDIDALRKQFHVWFDSFKTLKLIHYLTENSFPKKDMFAVLKDSFGMMTLTCPIAISEKTRSNVEEQMQVLNILERYSHSNMSLT